MYSDGRMMAKIEKGQIGLIETMTPDSGRTKTVAEPEIDDDNRRAMDTMELQKERKQ